MIHPQTISRMERMLPVATALLLAGAAFTAIRAMATSPKPPVVNAAINRPQPPQETTAQSPRLTMAELSDIWSRDLQQALIPPPPPPKPEPKPAPPPKPPPVLPRLLATFVETDRAWGLFSSSKSGQSVRSVAGEIDGFQVVEIGEGRATLRHATRTWNVEVPRSADR